ncbi:META domain-containing protein [Desulfogranum japonicum]|uniref:META domain-containing protein n=1 Tax=Desulfogranum japonicum TaxID=231447 RepID=UPI001377D345|nr:META domain-containing protein [Desulfogranum japonicum]
MKKKIRDYRNRIYICLLIFCLILIAGCSSKQPQNEPQPEETSTFPFNLPATFIGKIDCDKCEHVDLTLNLRDDGLYQLRKEYIYSTGETETEAQMRLWRYDKGEQLIILGKEAGALKTYQIVDEKTLRFLDKENTNPEELASYDLYRQQSVEPFLDVVKIRGMYSASNTNNMLIECSSGVSFPVDASADFYAMDRQYKSTPHQKGEGLLTSFQGHLISRKNGDILVVDRFNRIYPDQDCSGYKTKKGLIGPTWIVTKIKGQPLHDMDSLRTPFFTLNAESKQVNGFAGCNRFSGTYLFKGEIFLFNKIASTRMACPKGTEVERAFFEALDTTESFKIEEDTLYLKNSREVNVLTLQAQQ